MFVFNHCGLESDSKQHNTIIQLQLLVMFIGLRLRASLLVWTVQKTSRKVSLKFPRSLREMSAYRARAFVSHCHSPPSVRRRCRYVSPQCSGRLHSLTSACFGQRFSVESFPGLDGTLLDYVISPPISQMQVMRSPDVDNVFSCSSILHMAQLPKQGTDSRFSVLEIIL